MHLHKLWGKDEGELAHIPVHAVLQAIFDDILSEPELTKRDKELFKQWPEYNAAWRYVEENRYEEIIKQLKENYKDIAKS